MIPIDVSSIRSAPDDEENLFLAHLKKNISSVPYFKLEPGHYLFGTRHIFTKVERGWLYVAVGKDYIDIDTFLLD